MGSIQLIGLLLLVAGLPHALWPYKLAKLGEGVDAIGSRRSSLTVEPADWKVRLYRVLGILFSVVGVVILIVNL